MEDNNIERAIEANKQYEVSLDRQLEKDIDINFEGLAELIKDDDLFIWYKALIKEICLDYALKESISELKEFAFSSGDLIFGSKVEHTNDAVLNRIKELESKIL